MFLSAENKSVAKIQVERPMLLSQAEALFQKTGKAALQWGEVVTSLMDQARLKEGGARKRFQKMLEARVIRKEVAGLYVLTP
jgi:hypothetical protein